MIQLSDFFRHSLVLILKRKCLLGAGRISCAESGTPSTMISVRDAAVGIMDLGVMILCLKQTYIERYRFCTYTPGTTYLVAFWYNLDRFQLGIALGLLYDC